MRTQDELRRAVGRRAAEDRQGALVWGPIGLLAGGALGQNVWAAVSGVGLGILPAAWRRAEERADELAEEFSRLEARGPIEAARPEVGE